MSEVENYQQKYQQLLPKLSERSRRLVVAADAKSRGLGGMMFVHRASGISLPTIRKGIRELDEGVTLPEDRNRQASRSAFGPSSHQVTLPEDRNRQPGGGRKKLTKAHGNRHHPRI